MRLGAVLDVVAVVAERESSGGIDRRWRLDSGQLALQLGAVVPEKALFVVLWPQT